VILLKEKWDKPISKRGFKAISKKMSGWEKKYGFDGVRWAVNKYVSLKRESINAEESISKLNKELVDLKKRQKERGML
jgi:hypothetical protein